MSAISSPGVYGKLPTHGDFIQRELPSNFVTPWDEWLQHFIAGTKEKIGADWLDTYLTSPIWRFALSHGVLDDARWAGILMPSVDQVGRYFPFTVAMKMPDEQNPLEFLAQQSAWYGGIEELALHALDGEVLLDELVAELTTIELAPTVGYTAAGIPLDSYAMQIDLEADARSPASAYPCMLDSMMVKLLSSYSAWATTGSERVAPCVFSAPGLPAVSKLPAMIDGQWSHWGWQQPYEPRR